MKTLIVVAHGSRREESNTEIITLRDKLRQKADNGVERIESVFLEFVEPGPEAVIRKCIEEGANPVLVLPYFLAAGSHAAKDMPEIMSRIKTDHPDTELTLLPHIGAAEGMADLMLSVLP